MILQNGGASPAHSSSRIPQTRERNIERTERTAILSVHLSNAQTQIAEKISMSFSPAADKPFAVVSCANGLNPLACNFDFFARIPQSREVHEKEHLSAELGSKR
jgi:hypothetical protein